MSAAVEAVFWDFGGVFTGSPFHKLGEYATDLGTTARALVDTVLGYDEPDGDHPWHRLERGEISIEEAFAATGRRAVDLGLDGFDMKGFFSQMGSEPGSREAMFAGVARLRDAGVRNAILSNNIKEFAGKWQATLPTGLFDDIVDSSAVGCRKPDPAIYRVALGRLEVEPGASIFLDDHLANVEAARALGFTGFHVGADPRETLAEIEALVAERGSPGQLRRR